jgi:hypothetical protein
MNRKLKTDIQYEFNGYAGHVFQLLTENKSDEVIAGYLVQVVTERMCPKARTSDMAATVQALRRVARPDQSLSWIGTISLQ